MIKKMMKPVLVFIIVLMVGGCTINKDTPKPLSYYYTEAEKALLTESYEHALENYMKVLTILHNGDEDVDMAMSEGVVYFDIGYSYEQLGHEDKAIEAYMKAAGDPTASTLAKTALGNIYFHQKAYDKSKAYYEEVILEDNNAYEAFVNLSAIYALQEDQAMALSLLTQAIDIDSTRPDALLNRAYLFACIGDEALMNNDIKALKEMNFSSLDVYLKIYDDVLKEVKR